MLSAEVTWLQVQPITCEALILVCCVQDGRISMAGLSGARAKYLAEAIKDSVMNC